MESKVYMRLYNNELIFLVDGLLLSSSSYSTPFGPAITGMDEPPKLMFLEILTNFLLFEVDNGNLLVSHLL